MTTHRCHEQISDNWENYVFNFCSNEMNLSQIIQFISESTRIPVIILLAFSKNITIISQQCY